MEGTKILSRDEIANEYKWNSKSVFASQEAWETEFRDLEATLPLMKTKKDMVPDGAEQLLAVLRFGENIYRRVNKLLVYASMSHNVDMGDQMATGMYSRGLGLIANVLGVTAFLKPLLLSIGRETLMQWMAEDTQLGIYKHYIENLFRYQGHLRSGEVEELMGMLEDSFNSPDNIYGLLTDADFKFKPATNAAGYEVPFVQGTLDAILNGSDRDARRTAWENHRDTYLAFKNTLAATLTNSIKNNVFQTRVRSHDSTLVAALFRDNLSPGIFHNLISVFRKNLPIWHRYWRLRRQAMDVEILYPYDIWAPLTPFKPSIDYHRAVEVITAGLAPLGNDYIRVLKQGCLENRWVDIFPNHGKTASIFSSGSYDTFPFICTSFTNDIESLSTLAHELGHSMHSYLTNQHQPFVYADYSNFVAEVASNFHQAMVRAYLLDTVTDPSFQISILQEAMSNFHRYLFIMPMLAQFELETHLIIERGRALTPDIMIRLMADLFTEGYGGEIFVDRDRVGITWATFGHLYTDYYVFKYATGISAAHSLSNRVLKKVPSAVEDYLKFLGLGSSIYPLDALKLAGVDLTTTQAVEETFAILSGYVERLEKLLLK